MILETMQVLDQELASGRGRATPLLHRVRTGRWTRSVAVALLCLAAHIVFAQNIGEGNPVNKPEKTLPITGEVFSVSGHTAFVIMPELKLASKPTPWVWYAPTLPGLPGPEEKWMFEKFLAAGISIAGVDVGESCGNPKGRAGFTALYDHLVKKRGFAPKACLLARSRGGLMLYNWAAEHPAAVACVAGIYPVCDPSSWPGIQQACGAYGMTPDQFKGQLAKHNPVERLAPLAKEHVPIFHIHGDKDALVPLDKNSAELAKRYRALGGDITLKIVEGQGHNMWSGWFECQELVDFVIKHARPAPR